MLESFKFFQSVFGALEGIVFSWTGFIEAQFTQLTAQLWSAVQECPSP